MLDEERRFFEESFGEWQQKFPGKVVLVKGRNLVGVFDNDNDALAEGARRYQLQPFLVRRVAPAEDEISLPALTLGILCADPSSATFGPRTDS
jgi:hypothetical protein